MGNGYPTTKCTSTHITGHKLPRAVGSFPHLQALEYSIDGNQIFIEQSVGPYMQSGDRTTALYTSRYT